MSDRRPDDTDDIKITDRRHFDTEGKPRQPDAADPGEAGPPEVGAGPPAEAERGPGFVHQPVPPEGESPDSLPRIDFSSIVLFFRSSALVQLGLLQDPGGEALEANLDAARQMIDILTVLRAKTDGNLDEEEKRLLEQVLYELRLHFVNASSDKSSG